VKQSKNIHKKIYVKRIWVDKNEYDYIYITEDNFLQVVKSQEEKALNGRGNYMLVERAPWFYPSYRYVKANYYKAIWFLAGALVVALIDFFKSKIKI
jgi:hypothetical protein